MGVDFNECRVCREVYPDCGDVEVISCEKCTESICSDCIDKYNDFSDHKYWLNSEPAVQNNEEYLLTEFCPLCSGSAVSTDSEVKDA